jgi:hypothetical protein
MLPHSICFAYFVDNEFVGWYADSFGSCRKTPKLYSNTEEMLNIIQRNFSSKINKINSTSFDIEKDKVIGLGALSLASFDSEEIFRNKNVELRIVKCPIYDGPNPNFDKEEFHRLSDERRIIFNKELEAGNIPDGPSAARSNFVFEFDKKYGKIPCDNWIYADYTKVKEWALKTPTEFIGTIKVQ